MITIFENFNDISGKIIELNDYLKDKYDVELWLWWQKWAKVMIVSKIIVPKKLRNKGIGTKVMQEICDFADENKIKIGLTPTSDFGGSKKRLISFYKQFNFKKNKSYNFRESLVRFPQ